MGVMINLLPEARLIKIRDGKRKRLAATVMISIIVVVISIIATLLLLMAYNATIKALNDNTISTLKSSIAKDHDMEQQAATLQEHLAGFSNLNANRLYASKIFYQLGNAVPDNVSIKSFGIDESGLVSIGGEASDIKSISVFSKALEEYNVNFKPQPDLDRTPIFTNVQIVTVSKGNGGPSSYGMSFNVNPTIFSAKSGVPK